MLIHRPTILHEFVSLELPQEKSKFRSSEQTLKVVHVCLLQIFAAPPSPSTYEEQEAKPGYNFPQYRAMRQ